MPRIENREYSLDGTKGKNKTGLPTNLKWQIGLFLWHKPYRGGAGTAGGAKRPPRGIPKGAALGAPLVTFPASGKSPGVEGRSALLVRAGAKSDNLLPRGASPSQKSPSPAGPLGIAVALPVKNYPNNSVQISGISGSSVRTTSLPKSSAVSPFRRRRATTTSRASANS